MRFSTFYLPLCFVLLFLFSCEKDKAPEPVVVTTINPATGPHSTVVIITGSGFNSNAASNLVKFNGKEATVQSASSTQLVVTVPKAAGTGPVTVQDVAGPEFTFQYTTVVSTLAGSGTAGFTDGSGISASFKSPHGIAVDTLGNIYVADSDNHAIRKITSGGVVTTFAGNGTSGNTNSTGNAARFNSPKGIACDKNGNLFIADTKNNLIRKITPSGQVTRFSGDGYYDLYDGDATIASFAYPTGITVDANGYVFVADRSNESIRKITPAGYATTFAGRGFYGFVNGIGTATAFNYPSGITFDNQGNLLIADEYNNCIRKVTMDAIVTKFAGSLTLGFQDGDIESARFNRPFGVAVDKANNVYVADTPNNRIRKISPEGVVTTLAGDGNIGSTNGNGQTSRFYSPRGIAIDKNGVIYIADTDNHTIRKIILE